MEALSSASSDDLNRSDVSSTQSSPAFKLNDPTTHTPLSPPIEGSVDGDVVDPEDNDRLAATDFSPAPSTPPTQPSQPDPAIPDGAVADAPIPGNAPAGGGDGPPDLFSCFDDIIWDEIAMWPGVTHEHVPPKSRNLFRDLGNIVFMEASTGQIGAVKACAMFARAILHVPLCGKARPDTVVKSRLQRWEQGQCQSLLDDLADYEVAHQRRQSLHSDADERDKRVERKLADGEISKALQAAMPSGPYDGPIDMLRALHPPKPPGITLLDLPANVPVPTVEPMGFYRTLCETSRGTAQTATGWASDHMKDINICPCNDAEDPLFGFRAFTIAFVTGALPVSQEVFTHLASSKLVALKKPDSDKPRPVGVTGVFHRLGLSALLKAHKEPLAAYFGSKGEYGTGISGACQLLAWVFRLASEKFPLGIMMWEDLTNGFNSAGRLSVDKGLAQMPPQLQWLRRTFHAFYSEDVPLYFARAGEQHVIISATGTMQGDPAGGVWFDAAVQLPFNILRAEFVEATLAKYYDDLMAFIPPNADGLPEVCLLSEPRTASFPNAYHDRHGRSPVAVPMARAIANRWKYLAKLHCGLDVKDKWGVCSVSTVLHQEDYGNLPVVPGLLIMGTPVGPPAWVEAKTLEIAHEAVPSTYDAVTTLAKVQNQHLIARGCCGTARVQHLWQTVHPMQCYTAVDNVDHMTEFAVAGIFGQKEADIPDLIWMQIFLPQRFGGCGYRKSAHTHMLSYIGAFASAAYNDAFIQCRPCRPFPC
jgi:hypothetical protein